MADEKKPKIDLKARLGKATVGAATPAPAGVVSGAPVPVPIPKPVSSRPPGAIPPPVVPGIPVGPPSPFASQPSIDPSNPLAAVAAPYRAPAPQPAQPQRIEVDEATVQQARAAAMKRGLVVGGGIAVALSVVGYIAGQAAEAGAGRTKSRNDAQELATDVTKAKGQLEDLAKKLEDGRDQLVKQRKFPDQLAKDLAAINVDFDGTKLAGRRFSGFPLEVAGGLVELVTGVQALNDRKQVVQGLLTKLQKPLSEQLSAPAGQQTVQYVVAIDRDPAGNPSALIAGLQAPITFTPPRVDLPAEFTFTNPLTGQNTKLAGYKSGDISNKPAALYVVPSSFNKVCPSETSSGAAQLGVQMSNMIRDIRGEHDQSQDVVTDSKPGLVERADKLLNGLTTRVH